MKRVAWCKGIYRAEAQCLISLGPISSQPLAFVGSSDERASKTSVSENVKVQMQDGGMGRVSRFGREKELSVKTE